MVIGIMISSFADETWMMMYTPLATTNDTGVVSSHYTTNGTAKNKPFLGGEISIGDYTSSCSVKTLFPY